VTNTARLDANAHLVEAGILKRPPHFSELSRFPYLNGFVGFTHFRCSLYDVRERGDPAAMHSKNWQSASMRRNRRSTIPRGKLVFIKERRGE
jgi:hypothetical protein